MKTVVWLGADTLTYPEGGGHFWLYLNWALGLRGQGCNVVWLEHVAPRLGEEELLRLVALLKTRLERYGLAESVALSSPAKHTVPAHLAGQCVPLESAADADLLLNIAYASCSNLLPRFRRTALIDIDPGLLQVWMSEGSVDLPRHDFYFTIGETVGQPSALFPSGGIDWIYTPPCVALDWWRQEAGQPDAPFTTVSHWQTSKEWVSFGNESFHNDKRSGFLPYLDLPQHTTHPLELALCQAADQHLVLTPDEAEERAQLESKGWRVIHSQEVSSTPWEYQDYIRRSRGEFSCVKPSCVRLQNAWMSDRTICYLATGRPAVIEHTGPSRFLPDARGLFRFQNLQEAVDALDKVSADYEHHCQEARALAEEYFDSRKVVRRLLERALDSAPPRPSRRQSKI